MSDELKPCPFCGVGVRALSRYHPRDPNEWYVSCGARDCVMQPETPTYHTEAEAIAAWNRRSSSKRIEELEKALGSVRDYHEGRKPYDFHRLPDDERANAAFDAWQEVFWSVRATLKATP